MILLAVIDSDRHIIKRYSNRKYIYLSYYTDLLCIAYDEESQLFCLNRHLYCLNASYKCNK